MTYAEFPADPALAGRIDAIWTLSSDGAEPPARAGTILPDGAVEVVLSWTDSVGVPVPGTVLRGVVVGQMDAAAEMAYGGPVDITGIRISAAAGESVLGRSPVAFAGRIVSLDEGAPALVPLLARALDRPAAPADRLARILAALAARIAVAPPPDAAIAAAINAIVARRGRIRIGPLARSLDLSARQFERRFLGAVGLPPKRWVRVARFRAAAESLARRDRPALADLARDHGYADQAHLTREFAALSGITPSRAWWA